MTWRPARERPQREAEHEAERERVCSRWRYLPADYFTDRVDMIIDNKQFKVPTSARGLRYLKSTRIRGHLRTRQEGRKPGFTKPNQKRNKVNPGGTVNVCAAIIGGRVRVWHYLPRTWNGQTAADLYEHTLAPALATHRGEKAKYVIVEDNDPTGYKSKKAEEVKRNTGIEAIAWPRYSPDLNPLDFYVWHAVEQKALQSLSGPTTMAAYKRKLRRLAFALPEAEVRQAVESIRRRAKAVYDASGGDIVRD